MRRQLAAVAVLVLLLAGCGGSDDPGVEVAILAPTASGVFTQQAQEVRLGGTVAHAGFVTIYNRSDGGSVVANVTYFDGLGTWTADVYGLVVGANALDVVADRDGTGRWTARAQIVVMRIGG